MVDAAAEPAVSAVSVAADVAATACLAAAAAASPADATDVDAAGVTTAPVLWWLRLRPLLKLLRLRLAMVATSATSVDGGCCAMTKKRVGSQGTAGTVLL